MRFLWRLEIPLIVWISQMFQCFSSSSVCFCFSMTCRVSLTPEKENLGVVFPPCFSVSCLNRFQESDALIRKAAIRHAFQSKSNLKSVCPAGRISYFLIVSCFLSQCFIKNWVLFWQNPQLTSYFSRITSRFFRPKLKPETFLTHLFLTRWCKTGF